MRRVVMALAAVLTLVACSSGSKVRPKAPELNRFDWDAPQPNRLFLPVSDVSSLTDSLMFAPVAPRLGGLLHIDVTDSSKVDPNGMLLFFFYQDPQHGRIVVMEKLTDIQVSDLEGALDFNSEPSSTVSFSLIKLDNGSEALVETQKKPSEDGLAPNSVHLIQDTTLISIYGPDGTFTPDMAASVANLVLPKG